MRQIVYIRTLRIRAWPGAEPVRRVEPRRVEPRIERDVTPWPGLPGPCNVTPRATSRSIPVRVRDGSWLDRARRALDRLAERAGEWMRNSAGP